MFLSLLAAASFTVSQASAETIAVINFQQILHDSSAGKSVKEQLDAKQKTYQAEMSKKENELNKESENLAQQRAVLSPDAFEKKAKEFRAKTNDAQKEVQIKHNELDYALNSSLGEIQKTVLEIVANMAKQHGYSLVLPSSQLLYADSKLDITNEVLSQLNAKLPKVNVSFTLPASASGSQGLLQ
jgi:Skp family chaperone for outer membrane proteins